MNFLRLLFRRRPCDLCHGTGVIEFRVTGQQFPCNLCQGSGKARRVIFGFALLVLCALALPQAAHAQSCVTSAQVTLAGALRSSNGLPASNYTITLTPSQQGFIAGCGVNVQVPATCATSTDGTVVGIPNPLTATINTVGGTGTLPAGTYYSVIAFYDASGNLTLVSPETRSVVSSTSALVVNPPSSGVPAAAVGMDVYIGTSSGAETLQGQTTGTASFVQAAPLSSGTAMPSTNTTQCKLVANDAIWPVGTGYVVTMVDSNGNGIPGYPMQWQLMGAGTTINLSNGLPYYHGVVMYPSPILASPLNHGSQSISGPLSLGGYNLTNVGKIGFGTSTPGWPIDVENGAINASGGYLDNGAAALNHVLLGNGTAYVDSATLPYSILTGAPTLFYQTVQTNGTSMAQTQALNFSTQFSLSTPIPNPNSQTDVDLAPQAGLPAGGVTYNCANVTLNKYGVVTSGSNGSCAAVAKSTHKGSASCSPAGSSYATCSDAVTWPTAFADTSYWASCTLGTLTGGSGSQSLLVYITAQTTTGLTLSVQNNTSDAGVSASDIYCVGVHN